MDRVPKIPFLCLLCNLYIAKDKPHGQSNCVYLFCQIFYPIFC